MKFKKSTKSFVVLCRLIEFFCLCYLIDVSVGPIATGEAKIAEGGTELFNMIIDVASGRHKPWTETYGLHNDLCIFNPAPIT